MLFQTFAETRLFIQRAEECGGQPDERPAITQSVRDNLGRSVPADGPAELDARLAHNERLVLSVGLRHQLE